MEILVSDESEDGEELKSCPFCGEKPVFPTPDQVIGTFYEAGCEGCGIPTISIQVIDCFDYENPPTRAVVHEAWDQENKSYAEEYINLARREAIKMWNKRIVN